MVRGADLERLIRRFDRVLGSIEADALRRLDAALKVSMGRLEDELRRLYRQAAAEGLTEGQALREARARVLLSQVQASLTVTNGAQADDVFMQLVRRSYAAGAENALSALSLYQQQLVALSSGIRAEVLVRATNASARLAHRGTVFAMNVEQRIIDGITRGQSWARTAREIRQAEGVLLYDAERLVRTESIIASDEARRESYQANGVEYVQRLATMDSRVCGYCAERAGSVYRATEAPAALHPNCVVGGTVVSARGVSAYTRRWYEGPVVAVTTSNGHRLTVTPNHPVLTPSGWVGAGSLNVGGRVLSQGLRGHVRLGIEPEDEHVHGVVEELADAFFKAPQVATAPVPVTDEHFHGDGRGSKIAVVGADGHLRPDFYAVIVEHGVKFALGLAAVLSPRLYAGRQAAPRLAGDDAPAPRLVDILHALGPLRWTEPRPLDQLGITPRADRDSALAEVLVHCERCGSELVSKGFGAVTGQVALRDAPPREVQWPGGLDARSVQNGGDSRVPRDVGAGDGPDGLPFAVTPDDIVSIERKSFAGHVYNLETAAGMYVANGIMTHNCRCYNQPWKPEWQEAGLTDDEWYRKHRKEALDRAKAAGEKPRHGPAPFERMEDREPPTPVWTPG